MVKNDRYRGMDEFMPLYLFNEKKLGEIGQKQVLTFQNIDANINKLTARTAGCTETVGRITS